MFRLASEYLRDNRTLFFSVPQVGQEPFHSFGAEPVARDKLRPHHVRLSVFRYHLPKRGIRYVCHRRERHDGFFNMFPEIHISHHPTLLKQRFIFNLTRFNLVRYKVNKTPRVSRDALSFRLLTTLCTFYCRFVSLVLENSFTDFFGASCFFYF